MCNVCRTGLRAIDELYWGLPTVVMDVPGQFLMFATLAYYKELGTAAVSDCKGPHRLLSSDEPTRTCTEIFASKNKLEYKCTSLIGDIKTALKDYCPVELCKNKNGTWSKPSISCALSECYEEGNSQAYSGRRTCTASGRPCQRWEAQSPNRHRFKLSAMYPDDTIALAGSRCRDPHGDKGYPWCFTLDRRKKWEACGVQKCSDLVVYNGYVCEEAFVSTVQPRLELPACGDTIDYKLSPNAIVVATTFWHRPQRSAIECATRCSEESSCQMFTYQKSSATCTLFRGLGLELIERPGYKSGQKLCNSMMT